MHNVYEVNPEAYSLRPGLTMLVTKFKRYLANTFNDHVS